MTAEIARHLDVDTTLTLPLTGRKLIEASAGTGKTHTIANLYLRMVLEGYDVASLLVVTFTNAATEELRGRLRATLYEVSRIIQGKTSTEDPYLTALLAEQDPTTAKPLLERAVRSMDEAAIYTIHSFCRRTLTDFAFSSGQSFGLELTGEDDDLWREGIKDWWRSTLYPLTPEEYRIIRAALGDLSTFFKAQQSLRSAAPYGIEPTDDRTVNEQLGDILTHLAQCRRQKAAMADIWAEQGQQCARLMVDSPAVSGNKIRKATVEKLCFALDAWFSEEGSPFALPDKADFLTRDKLDEPGVIKKGAINGPDHQALQTLVFFDRFQQFLNTMAEAEGHYREQLLQLRMTALSEATRYARDHARA